MRYGFVLPGGDLPTLIELASEVEEAGWDGVFYWDGIYIESETLIYDPWVLLAAFAMRTRHIRLGVVLTPLSRRRPWKVARETVTLDLLSHGRLTLSVGLGDLNDGGFTKVGETLDRKLRAELLDESLAILNGLWSGKPFSFHGKYYNVEEMTFLPSPSQSPRIPIWVVGAWPYKKSMQRALQYDGVLAVRKDAHGSDMEIVPADIQAISKYIAEYRTLSTPFDIVLEGETPGDDPEQTAAVLRPWIDSGVTWWLETRWPQFKRQEVRTRLRQGPPHID